MTNTSLKSPPLGGVRLPRVVAVGGDPAACQLYREALTSLGYQVAIAESARQALELCRTVQPDVLVTDAALPDGGGLAVAAEAGRDRPVPVVLVSAADGRACRGPGEEHVFAHLLAPVGPAQLETAIRLAVRTFEKLRAAQSESAELRQAADDRKVIERAKGLVARYVGLDEDAAYRRLRRLATDSNRKLVDVARDVLAAGDVFKSLEPTADGPARTPVRVSLRRNGSFALPDGSADGVDGKGGTP